MEEDQPITIRVATPTQNYVFAVGLDRILLWDQLTTKIIWQIRASLEN